MTQITFTCFGSGDMIFFIGLSVSAGRLVKFRGVWQTYRKCLAVAINDTQSYAEHFSSRFHQVISRADLAQF